MARITTKGNNLNSKRIIEASNYLYSIASMVNPSMGTVVKNNPIGIDANIKALQELEAEVATMELMYNEIDLENVFNFTPATETEKVIIASGNGHVVARSKNKYEQYKQSLRLEEAFPRAEREERVRELEELIRKEVLKGATVGKLSKELRITAEERANELRRELNSLEETFNVTSKKEILLELYSIGNYELTELKTRIKSNLEYLKGVIAYE